MSSRPTLRFAARLARREVARRPWRSALVAFLVAVPVATMAAGAVFVRTSALTEGQRWRLSNGGADALLQGPAIELPPGSRTVSFRQDHEALIRTADGQRARGEISDQPLTDPMVARVMRVDAGRVPRDAGEAFLTHDIAGRLKVGVGDVLVLERPAPVTLTVVGVGERRAYEDGRALVVAPGTAVGLDSTNDGPRPDGAHQVLATLVDLPDDMTRAEINTWYAAAQMPGAGVQLDPDLSSVPYLTDGDNAATAVHWSWVAAAVVFTVVGIVIAAAFASGARRQLATLGQLAANGAGPAVLRRVLFLQGTWTGIIGSLAGFVLGAAVLAGLAPHRYALFSTYVGPWDVRLFDLVPVGVIGVVAATVAALVPARTISRVPVLSALAGRRPLGRVPRWLTVSGLVAVSGGLALLGLAVLGSAANGAAGGGRDGGTVWTLTGIIGGVGVLLGTCAIAPGYISFLEPLAGRLRGSWRLAARSLARQRTRTGGVVSAVCATAALAVTASALMLGADAKATGEPPYLPLNEIHVRTRDVASSPGPFGWSQAVVAPDPDVVGRLVETIPAAETLRLTTATPPRGTGMGETLRDFVPAAPVDHDVRSGETFSGRYDQPVVADAAALSVYQLDADERRLLEQTGALALGPAAGTGTVDLLRANPNPTPSPGAVPADQITSTVYYYGPGGSPSAEVIEKIPVAVVNAMGTSRGGLESLLLTPDTVRRLGFSTAPGDLVLRLPKALTDDQVDAAREIAEASGESPGEAPAGFNRYTQVNFDFPNDRPDPLVLEGILSGMALLLTLFVVAASLALAAAETRDERDVLSVVGASPAVLRRASAHKAWLLSFLGTVLAIPVGFLPVVVFTRADPTKLPLVFPWRVVVLLVIVVPVVAGAVTTLASRLALRRRPVTISTMAFE
jgi:putative ABC transport system permease protein